MSLEQKHAFERAALEDGVRLSAWFRWLAEQRLAEQQGGIPRSNAAKLAQLHSNGSRTAPPEPSGFIPGYGLEEDD